MTDVFRRNLSSGKEVGEADSPSIATAARSSIFGGGFRNGITQARKWAHMTALHKEEGSRGDTARSAAVPLWRRGPV